MNSAASISHATSHNATSANGVHQGAGDRSRLDNAPSKQNSVTLWWSRQEAREGGASFAGLVFPVDVIATLRDDLSGLIERGHRHRCEHGASGDQGVKFGHWNALEFRLGGADQTTICAAWFRVAKATGANTAQAAIRA